MSTSLETNSPSPTDSLTLRLLIEALQKSGSGNIQVRGESMEPTLENGQQVHVRVVTSDALGVGQVGVFVSRDVLIIHRLVWKRREGGREWLIFQGDNSGVREKVEPSSVLGKVIRVETGRTPRGTLRSRPVGDDQRAFFYRNAYRLHSVLDSLVSGSRLPTNGERPGLLYRALRYLFRLCEQFFAPHPRNVTIPGRDPKTPTTRISEK